jgi:hypothetical protein
MTYDHKRENTLKPHIPMNKREYSMFDQFKEAARPAETINHGLKMYKFKPTLGCIDEGEMVTVIAESHEAAVRKNPKMLYWLIHSVTK